LTNTDTDVFKSDFNVLFVIKDKSPHIT